MISPESLGLLHDLYHSPSFRRALAELVTEQVRLYGDAMRGHVKAGDIGRAQQAEGSATAWEDVRDVLRQKAEYYAAHPIPNRP